MLPHHDVVLPHLGAIEHGVEGGHLIHTDGGHFQHLGHLQAEGIVSFRSRHCESSCRDMSRIW